MATETLSDELRSRQDPISAPPEAPGPPPAGAQTPFASLAERITAASEGQQAAAGRVREGLTRKAEVVEPRIAAVEEEIARPRPTMPAPPVVPPPPTRKLTEFLAPVDGESPTASITKLLQAVGLFATGISGAARGDARAGLAAFKGAMEGWQAGDKERADRAFADWQAKTEAAVKGWERERATYQDIMQAANLSLDSRFRLVQLAALREDNKMAADVAEKQDLEGLVNMLGKQQQAAQHLNETMLKIMSSKQDKDAQREMTERLAVLGRESQMAMAKMMDQSRRDIAAQASADRALAREERAAERAEGKPTPATELKNIQDIAFSQGIVNEMGRLVKSPTVRLEKVMGGIRPWLNNVISTGKIVDGIAVDPKLFGTLSPDEQRLISLSNDYADVILRIRSGAAITPSEFNRMIGFIATPASTPEVFQQRLTLQTDLLNAKKKAIRETLSAGGYKAPDITAPSLAPETPKEAAAPPIPGVGAPPRPGMILAVRKSDRAMGWIEPGKLGDKYERVR